MAVPILETIIDDFNRADGLIYAGAGAALWETQRYNGTGATDLVVSTNRLGTTITNSNGVTKPVVNGSGDCDIVIDFASGLGDFLLLLLLTDALTGQWDAYRLEYTNSTSTWALFLIVNGTQHSGFIGGSSATSTLVAGDSIWFSTRGSTVAVSKAPAAGAYTQLLSGTDSTLRPPDGRVAVVIPNGANASTKFDNLRGGPLYQATPNPDPQTIAISNTTDGSPMPWTATKTQSWLTLSPAAGTTPGGGGSSTLTVQPVTGALAPGTYNDTITIASTRGTNTPQTVAVSFTVATGGGPVSLTGTAADTVALSDAAARAPTPLTRVAADAVALSDAATRALVVPRTAADTVVVSDAAVRAAATRLRPAADSVALSDAVVRAAAARARTATDSVATSDVAVRAPAARLRLAADAVTLSDAAAGVFTAGTIGLTRTASESW
jgi:hypothetical protein